MSRELKVIPSRAQESKKIKIRKNQIKRAVVLLSGGLDSAVALFYAKSKGFKTYSLTFNYGQRHKKEISRAAKLARRAASHWQQLVIELPWKGSSLLDKKLKLPEGRKIRAKIPSTYVPGRNIIFLSFAASYAESIKAGAIFIGVNIIDYSGYPDCREEFLKSIQQSINIGTKRGVENKGVRIYAPLLKKNKQQIVLLAKRLNVPLEMTWSCYKGERKPCGVCDSCKLRKSGFDKAKVIDPAL
ncbi:MAG: 7-cyano-7-deazaguanine synthase QueC [Candidatus Omnitrophica bacterium]|nr:7-cyano-7-deazaguanine synthase QueC [Candidatus Omnitrophota bacterium]